MLFKRRKKLCGVSKHLIGHSPDPVEGILHRRAELDSWSEHGLAASLHMKFLCVKTAHALWVVVSNAGSFECQLALATTALQACVNWVSFRVPLS